MENIVDEGNGTYSFSYAGVYANSMNENVKFTVMEQGKPVSSTMTYSIASYASNYINSSQYPALTISPQSYDVLRKGSRIIRIINLLISNSSFIAVPD